MPKFTQIFIALFVLFMTLTVLQVQCYAQKKRRILPPKFFVKTQNGKYGAVDKEGKIVLPFIYHDCRLINNDLFVVQDSNKLCSEYVIDAKQKILTEPIFCEIDSFIRGKVYQYWNKTRLIYTSNGVCLTATEKHEKKGLFKIYLRNLATNEIYKHSTSIPINFIAMELIFVSPNQYQYKAQGGEFILIRRRTRAEQFNDNYLSFSNGGYAFVVEIKKILIQNTKTKEEKSVIGNWICSFNHYNSTGEFR